MPTAKQEAEKNLDAETPLGAAQGQAAAENVSASKAGKAKVEEPKAADHADADESAASKDDTWKEDKDVEMRRVFRVLLFKRAVPFRETVHTLMQKKTVIEGTELEAESKSVESNAANQYVLEDGAVQYKKQLSAIRRLEKKGIFKEISPVNEGIPWIPKIERDIKEAEDVLKKLRTLRG